MHHHQIHFFHVAESQISKVSQACPVTVTTRIIPFLVGNPYKPSFETVTGWGVDLTYIASQNPARFFVVVFYRENFLSFYKGGIDCLESEALAIITDPLGLVYLSYMNG